MPAPYVHVVDAGGLALGLQQLSGWGHSGGPAPGLLVLAQDILSLCSSNVSSDPNATAAAAAPSCSLNVTSDVVLRGQLHPKSVLAVAGGSRPSALNLSSLLGTFKVGTGVQVYLQQVCVCVCVCV